MAVAEEEADESAYWLELLIESEAITHRKAEALLAESRELTAIASASRITARRSNRKSEIDNRQSPRKSNGAAKSR